MKRFLAGLAVLLTITISGAPAHAASYEQPLDRACRFQYDDGHAHWTTTEVRKTIVCAVRRWPVPRGRDHALYIAYRESRYHQFAYNPSGCSGVYQWARGTWARVLPAWSKGYRLLGHSVFNARSNVLVAIHYAHHHGWAPWGG